MGFHEGWGKALDQLVTYVKTFWLVGRKRGQATFLAISGAPLCSGVWGRKKCQESLLKLLLERW